MPHSPSFERDVGRLRRLLDDAFKGIGAAETVLFHHSEPEARLTAINFPLEESLVQEAVGLLTAWKVQTVALLRKLDAETASANLQFERLFDENAGRQSQGFLKRRVRLGHAAPEEIAAELVDLLSLSAALNGMLADAKPVLVDQHRNCEASLLRLVSRRQGVDLDLEEVGRRMVSLKAQRQERRTMSVSWRSPAAEAESEEERRNLTADRQAAQAEDERLRSEWETLQRMIADDEDFVEALNAGIAVANVMAAKLGVDIEQRVALLKAADTQSSTATAEAPAPVQGLIAAFDANILAGHDLLMRKQRVDDAFARRLEAIPSASEVPAEGDGDAEAETDASDPRRRFNSAGVVAVGAARPYLLRRQAQ